MVVEIEIEVILVEVFIRRLQDAEGGAEHSLVVSHVGAIEDAVKAWLMVLELDPDYDFTTLVNLPKFGRNT